MLQLFTSTTTALACACEFCGPQALELESVRVGGAHSTFSNPTGIVHPETEEKSGKERAYLRCRMLVREARSVRVVV